MAYLSALHAYFMIYHYGDKKFDITRYVLVLSIVVAIIFKQNKKLKLLILQISSPFMILTQKLTYLAFSYYDGMKPDSKLTEWQRKFSIK